MGRGNVALGLVPGLRHIRQPGGATTLPAIRLPGHAGDNLHGASMRREGKPISHDNPVSL